MLRRTELKVLMMTIIFPVVEKKGKKEEGRRCKLYNISQTGLIICSFTYIYA
jgi:hypothetical protein